MLFPRKWWNCGKVFSPTPILHHTYTHTVADLQVCASPVSCSCVKAIGGVIKLMAKLSSWFTVSKQHPGWSIVRRNDSLRVLSSLCVKGKIIIMSDKRGLFNPIKRSLFEPFDFWTSMTTSLLFFQHNLLDFFPHWLQAWASRAQNAENSKVVCSHHHYSYVDVDTNGCRHFAALAHLDDSFEIWSCEHVN